MRIALLSPYSWTYPGGVTRHIEALCTELTACGHDATILAPFDPDDALSRRLHRGARPQRLDPPERFISLGRTAGFPANGAVSNLVATPGGMLALRRELRGGDYDVLHIHEPVVPLLSWDALCSTGPELPLVGTFHTYSENVLTNGIAAIGLGGRRRMNHLHARIAVSEAAAWTARRFYGGRYRIVPNGVHLGAVQNGLHGEPGSPLRILFIGQAVERKGLPVLLRAFEALREHVGATLTLVGADREEVAHMMLDDRGVHALGKVSESRKLAELAQAEVLCAPSLHGESFGMVLTEALAAATPVVASDIPGYRDVVRDGIEGLLTPPGDALALAEALRSLALDSAARIRMSAAARLRAERFSWPHVAAEVLDCYEQALAVGRPATRAGRVAVRFGLAPADLLPRVPAQRLPSLETAGTPSAPAPRDRSRFAQRALRRLALMAALLGGLALALLALVHIGVGRVVASLLASSPGLLAAGLGLMCASMFARAIAWHAILSAAPTWRKANRRDAMQGTFIGVLMSATLPARLGEPSRALIVARRLGRARETLPVVLGTMVSQTLLNLLALGILGVAMFSSVDLFNGHHGAIIAVALAPLGALVAALLAPALVPRAADRSEIGQRSARLQALMSGLRLSSDACPGRAARVPPSTPGDDRDDRATRSVGVAVDVLLAAADGAWPRCPRRGRGRRGGAVRRQRHRGPARHAGQCRCLSGGVCGRARRRLPRLHPRRARLRHRPAGGRGRHGGADGHARARQRGALLEGRAPADDVRSAGEARAAAGGHAVQRRQEHALRLRALRANRPS